MRDRWLLAGVGCLALLACDSDAIPAAKQNEPGAAAPEAEVAKADAKVSDKSQVDLQSGEATKPGEEAAKAAAVGAEPGASAEVLQIEARSAAVSGGKLVHNVGLKVMGNRLAPTLAVGCAAPCWQPIPMWPSGPSETSIEFELFRGPGSTVTGATRLGRFVVDSIPAPKQGARTEVLVGLGVTGGAIVGHAKLRATGAPLPLRKL